MPPLGECASRASRQGSFGRRTQQAWPSLMQHLLFLGRTRRARPRRARVRRRSAPGDLGLLVVGRGRGGRGWDGDRRRHGRPRARLGRKRQTWGGRTERQQDDVCWRRATRADEGPAERSGRRDACPLGLYGKTQNGSRKRLGLEERTGMQSSKKEGEV